MKSTVLIISQVYVPDPAAVGQYLHDVCRKLVAQGKRVIVFTSTRGYEDPFRKYKRHEIIDGVNVWRLPLTSFGKNPIIKRLLGGVSLALQSMILGLFVRDLTHILVSTAPPTSSLAAQFIALCRKVKIVFWAMDINPEQMVAMGKIEKESFVSKFGDAVNRSILMNAHRVIVLDSFMAETLRKKADFRERQVIIPPWPYEHQLVNIDHAQNPFRKKHNLNGKFVVMYSGNISPIHPIDTLLEAIKRIEDEESFLFMFIGGEAARKNIEEFALHNKVTNIVTLPYVPLEETQYSLSAADVHIITMGENMVGIVHPCKIYGVMSTGRPFILFGPKNSHIGEILKKCQIGWQINHGDIDGTVEALRSIEKMPQSSLTGMGSLGREIVTKEYSRKKQCSRFCEAFR
jgi:glycosyltransferase involved in cell wall biosynthesis